MRWAGRFLDETPEGLRRLALLLYALVGPVFTAVLYQAASPDSRAAATAAVAGLVVAGGAWLLVRRSPRPLDWIFPAAVSPTVCCGIAYVACGSWGPAYLGVLGAPVAWAAVLYEGPVVVVALAVAIATCFVAVAHEGGPTVALANTLVFGTITGLVAGVVFGKARALREARELQRRAEEELRQLHQRASWLARFPEEDPGPVLRLGADAVVRYANRSARAASEGTLEEGRLAPPVLASAAAEALAGGRTVWREVALGGRTLSLTFSPAGGEVNVYGQDVTQRKAAEETTRRLLAAVEQAPVSIVITDETGLIEYVNPAFERTTGYARAEALGQNPRILKSDQHDAEFYRGLWDTIAAGRIWTGKLVNRNKAGDLYTEDVVIAPVRDTLGQVRNYVAVKRDISRELVLQQQFLESQKLESVGRLAGGVAHDFNNLLTVILSCAGAMEERLAQGAVPDRADVEEVRLAGERARDLTRQLLAFARRQVVAPVSLDLNQVMRASEKLLRRVLGEDVALRVELAPDLGLVSCDPGQLDQVILNLAVNARDAMPGGGELAIQTSNLAIGDGEVDRLAYGASPGAFVRLAVQDTGTGMSPEIQRHLFEPFFTTKTMGKGTGLGLATVYGIVRQFGGFIRVESAPGRGSLFEVCLPRTTQAPATEPRRPVARPARGWESILLVEDDAAVREVAARALRSGGYRVLAAGAASEALEVASREPGDLALLVTDVVMPGLDGRSLADELRSRRPGLRVLFVSGYTHDTLGSRGVLDSGIEFLEKPFTAADLLGRVRAVLDGP